MENKSYSDKLKDPRWQRKRLEIMQRDNFGCRICGDKDQTLNIHHIEYKNELWDVDSLKLITLCEDCHKEIHSILKKGNTHWLNRHAAYANHNNSEFIILLMLLANIQTTNKNILQEIIIKLNGWVD